MRHLLPAASPVLALLALVGCPLAAEDQITPTDTLTFDITDQMSEIAWLQLYGYQNLTNEFYGPTFFNTFIDAGDGDSQALFSGIADPEDYGILATPFTTLSNSYSPEPESVSTNTEFNAPGSTNTIAVSHVLAYNGGGQLYASHTWSLSNFGDSDQTNTFLRYGGVTSLNNWEAGLGMATPAGLTFGSFNDEGNPAFPPIVYVIQPQYEGYYALFSDPANLPGPNNASGANYSNCVVDNAGAAISALGSTAPSASLSGVLNADYPYYSSAAPGLEWAIPGISYDGEESPIYPSTVTITAWESWSGTGTVSVNQPTIPNAAAYTTGTVPVTFQINDQSGAGGTYYVIVQGTTCSSDGFTHAPALTIVDLKSGGVTLTGPTPQVTLPPGGSVTVTADVEATPDAVSSGIGTALVSLLALNTTNPFIGDQNNGPINIGQQPPVVVAGPTAAGLAMVPLTLTYSVTNNENVQDTFSLAFSTGSPDIAIISAPPSSVMIGSGQTALVTAVIQGDSTMVGTMNNLVGMTATSQLATALAGTGSASIDFTNYSASGYTLQAGMPTLTGVTGDSYQLTFTLSNNEDSDGPDTFDLQYQATGGIVVTGVAEQMGESTVQGEAPIVLDSDSQMTIVLTVVAPSGSSGGTVDVAVSSVDLDDTATASSVLTLAPPTLLAGPTMQSATSGALTTAIFTLDNQGTVDDTYQIQLNPPDGMTIISSPSSVEVAAGTTQNFTISYITSSPGTLGVTATSDDNPAFSGSVADVISIAASTTPIMVTPPAPATTPLGGSGTTATFTVTNDEATPDTFTLLVQETGNVSVQGTVAPSVSLDAGASQQVTITYIGTAGTAGSLSLTATSQATPSESATGTAQITFTPAQSSSTPVVVTPPPAVSVAGGSAVVLTFLVDNQESTPDSFSLALVVPSGITVVGVQQPLVQADLAVARGAPGVAPTLQPVALASGATATILVTVVATPSATQSVEDVQLIATSQSSPLITDTATAQVTVAGAGQTAGGAVTLSSPAIPASSNGNVLFVPISGATAQGALAIDAFVAANPASSAGFTFDATAQSFVPLPIGGLSGTAGVFIASSSPATINLSGNAILAPAAITLQPGWNFIGIPPVDPGDGTPILQTHAFPQDFDVLDSTGTLITSAATFADTLGTVGSGDPSTAEPYLYDGASYAQVATLQSGVGYWIKNNSNAAVTLTRVLSGATLSAFTGAGRANGVSYTDRGTPPNPPTSALGSSTASGSSCGLASGASVLFMLGMINWRRRRLR